MFQATLFLSIPVILIVVPLLGLVLLVVYHRSGDKNPVPVPVSRSRLAPILPYYRRPAYGTFSDSASSYAADDESSVVKVRRATASIIHTPSLPTIEDDVASSIEQLSRRESPDINTLNEPSRFVDGHSRGLDAILASPKYFGDTVSSPTERDVGSGDDVPRGRVRRRIGSGGSGEWISRWLAPRWREQSIDVEGQRSIGKRTKRHSRSV